MVRIHDGPPVYQSLERDLPRTHTRGALGDLVLDRMACVELWSDCGHRCHIALNGPCLARNPLRETLQRNVQARKCGHRKTARSCRAADHQLRAPCAALQEENDTETLTYEKLKTIAFALMASFFRDSNDESMNESDKMSADQIASIAYDLDIPAPCLAGAYFVESGVSLSEDSFVKNSFDEALHDALGDDYALAFLSELSRLHAVKIIKVP